MNEFKLSVGRIKVPDSIQEISRIFYERGWTDGLPVIPPTDEAVERLLKGISRKPDEVIGLVPPKWAEATVEKIAVNAVMAGCLPEHMPVIIAALEALLDEKFNLYGVQTTTHPCTPLLIINGPIREKLGINSGYNAFSQGNFANAVIGRAIRLILLNIGGGILGKVDKATHGHPGKLAYCVGENEEKNPWEPLHVERGFKRSESTVTVVAAESPHNINDHSSITAQGILTTIAGTMATPGNNNVLYQVGEPLVVLGPEHAATVARGGLTKEEVKEFLWENARVPCARFSQEHREQRFADFKPEDLIPIARRKEDIMVIVSGGAGKHSLFIPTFGDSWAVTKPIKA